jgi:flagellar assembly protein FliH
MDAAVAQFNERQQSLITALREALRSLDSMKQDLRIAAERDVLELAVHLAGRLTFAVGALHREAAVENLREALRLVDAKTSLAVRVHPRDLESLRLFAEDWSQRSDRPGAIRFQPDESLAPGGCVVTAGPTEVDASLETLVNRMVASLLGREEGDA